MIKVIIKKEEEKNYFKSNILWFISFKYKQVEILSNCSLQFSPLFEQQDYISSELIIHWFTIQLQDKILQTKDTHLYNVSCGFIIIKSFCLSFHYKFVMYKQHDFSTPHLIFSHVNDGFPHPPFFSVSAVIFRHLNDNIQLRCVMEYIHG